LFGRGLLRFGFAVPVETAGQDDDPEQALREVRGRFIAGFSGQ